MLNCHGVGLIRFCSRKIPCNGSSIIAERKCSTRDCNIICGHRLKVSADFVRQGKGAERIVNCAVDRLVKAIGILCQIIRGTSLIHVPFLFSGGGWFIQYADDLHSLILDRFYCFFNFIFFLVWFCIRQKYHGYVTTCIFCSLDIGLSCPKSQCVVGISRKFQVANLRYRSFCLVCIAERFRRIVDVCPERYQRYMAVHIF